MKIIVLILFLLYGLIPVFVLAYGITVTVLSKKHKIGDLSQVEFSGHLSRTIDEFECNIDDMRKKIRNFRQ